MLMNILDYDQCGLPMRDDRTEMHRAAWRHICSPGAPFTAADRIDLDSFMADRSAEVREAANINPFREHKERAQQNEDYGENIDE